MNDFSVCDLCDAHEDLIASGALRIVPPGWLRWGQAPRFAGRAATLKVFEDNSLVRAALEEPGEGRVLVIDGGASLRCALVGGNLAQLADRNGWVGIVVSGCVRDSAELQACRVGIRALALHPQKSVKRGIGERGVAVSIGGVTVRPDDWVYEDGDGVVICDRPLHA